MEPHSALNSAVQLLERVAGRPDGTDDDTRRGRLQSPSEPTDVDVDCAYTDMDIGRPGPADQLVPTEDLAGRLEQMPQHVELDRSEMDVMAIAANPVGIELHLKAAIGKPAVVFNRV